MGRTALRAWLLIAAYVASSAPQAPAAGMQSSPSSPPRAAASLAFAPVGLSGRGAGSASASKGGADEGTGNRRKRRRRGGGGDSTGALISPPPSLAEPARPSSFSSASHSRVEAQMNKVAGTRGHWQDAIRMFEEIVDSGVIPTRAAYAAAIRACAKGGDGSRAMRLYHEFLSQGFEPDPLIIAAAVKACCRGGQQRDAWRLLESGMARGGWMGGDGNGDVFSLVLSIFRYFSPTGIQMDSSLFGWVINTCFVVGDSEGILDVAAAMRRESIPLDATCHNRLIMSHVHLQVRFLLHFRFLSVPLTMFFLRRTGSRQLKRWLT
jgi:pentatricopeptide repeat protein